MNSGLQFGPRFSLSPACVQYCQCAQLSTDTQITDSSGNANHIDKGPDQTWDAVAGTYGVWATAGRARTYAHTDQTRTWAVSRSWWDGFKSTAREALLLFWRGEFTLPASSLSLIRLGVSSNLPGFQLRVGAGGNIDAFVRTSPETLVATSATTGALAGTVSETVALLLDGANQRIDVWINGDIQAGQTAALPLDGNVIQETTPSAGYFGNTNGSLAASIQEFHSYVIKDVPSNIDDLVTSLHWRKYLPLQSSEVIR